MAAFRCVFIPTETAERSRATGFDDGGDAVRRLVATEGGGLPWGHCLRSALPGEEVLLGSRHLPRPCGVHCTPGPIFVHAEDCSRFEAAGEVAPVVRPNALASVRAYDADDQCLYELGQVCAGAAVDAPLGRALADPRTTFVNVHTARPGCLLSRVDRGV